MSYAAAIRETFPTLAPEPADFFLLEAHQIEQLPDRLRAGDVAVFLGAHPDVARYLVARHPPLREYVDSLPAPTTEGSGDVAAVEERILWEIGDLFVYQRAADLYDALPHDWDLSAVTDVAPIAGTTVVDAGAGTGQVAFSVADQATTVFAVEPASGMRRFMIDKARRIGAANLFVLDGTSSAIPLPDNTADVLVTCRAIGWDLEREVAEIERVVRRGGHAVHLLGVAGAEVPAELDAFLTNDGYVADAYEGGAGSRRKYWKQI